MMSTQDGENKKGTTGRGKTNGTTHEARRKVREFVSRAGSGAQQIRAQHAVHIKSEISGESKRLGAVVEKRRYDESRNTRHSSGDKETEHGASVRAPIARLQGEGTTAPSP